MPWKRRPKVFWLDLIGAWVLRLAIFGLVALTAVQMLMTSDPFRIYLSFAERMESGLKEDATGMNGLAPVTNPQTASPLEGAVSIDESSEAVGTSLTLKLVNFTSLQKATVKVNGELAGGMGNKELKIVVENGDLIEIDTSFYPYQVEIMVSETSPELLYPRKGQSISIQKEAVLIGPVKVKQ